MKVVLFCGGYGMRMRNGSEDIRWVSGDHRSGVVGALLGEGSGGDRERYRVATYRCSRCGALESFALDPA